MRATDFASYLSKYLGNYLAGQQNFSGNTILSYRDTFKLLLRFCRDQKGISPEKLSLKAFDKNLITDFLTWLKTERNCGISTRQQRLTVIRSFFTYLQGEAPEHLLLCQSIMGLQLKKKPITPPINYLSFEGIQAILAQPDQRNWQGRRDMVLLALLYDSGARVQELTDIRVRDIRLSYPAGVNLHGKGSKWRHVPLMRVTADLLKEYLQERRLTSPEFLEHPLFTNRSGQKLTRAGVAYIVDKYAAYARESNPSYIPQDVTPHTFRHSKAMHLLQSGVDLIYIRDLLGHSDVKTTEVYARIDSDSKRKALENVYRSPTPEDRPLWTEDETIMKILQGLV